MNLFIWKLPNKWAQTETTDTTNDPAHGGPPTFLSWRPKRHRLNPNPGTGRPRPLRLLLHLASDGQGASSSARVILYRTTSPPPSASRRLLPLPRVAVVSRSERQAPLRRNGACGLAPDLPPVLSDSTVPVLFSVGEKSPRILGIYIFSCDVSILFSWIWGGTCLCSCSFPMLTC